MSLSLLPFAPARWFDNSGNALAGGFLWFYRRGTSTPATGAIWRDPDRTNGWTNPVQLDSSGHADVYLDPGSYTVKLLDQYGAQILPPVDVIQSGAFGSQSGLLAVMVANYAALAAISVVYDAIYVMGRLTEGDGGEGWFQRVAGSSDAADSGYVLVGAGERYRRVMEGYLSPRWWGVSYGLVAAQDVPFLNALTAAAYRGIPLQILGPIVLAASINVPYGASVAIESQGAIVSAAPVNMTFQPGSRLLQASRLAFETYVQPVFSRGTVDRVHLSWMGGVSDNARLAKLAACSTDGVTVVIDDTVVNTANQTFPKAISVDVAGGSISIPSACSLTIPTLEYQGRAQWVLFGSAGAIQANVLGSGPAYPEWFGAAGSGSGDDSLALLAAMSTGWVKLEKQYRIASNISWAGSCVIEGLLQNAVDIPSTATYPVPMTLILPVSGQIRATGTLDVRNCAIGVETGHADGAVQGNTSTTFRRCWLGADAYSYITTPGVPTTYLETVIPVYNTLSATIADRFRPINRLTTAYVNPALVDPTLYGHPSEIGLKTDSTGKIIPVTNIPVAYGAAIVSGYVNINITYGDDPPPVIFQTTASILNNIEISPGRLKTDVLVIGNLTPNPMGIYAPLKGFRAGVLTEVDHYTLPSGWAVTIAYCPGSAPYGGFWYPVALAVIQV